MLWLCRIILYVFSIPIVLLAIFLLLTVQNKSILNGPEQHFSPQDIKKVKSILYANQQSTDETITLTLTERDLNLACNYLLNLYFEARVDVRLAEHYIQFKINFILPKNIFGQYLNIQFQLYLQGVKGPQLQKLRIGSINIADYYAGFLIDTFIKYSRFKQYLMLIQKNLKGLNLHNKKLYIDYKPPGDSFRPIRALLVPKIDEKALEQYQHRLRTLLEQHNPKWLLSLSEILQGLFELAEQRSHVTNTVMENKLVIFIANRYINQSKAMILKQNLPYYPVYMYKRTDIVQHFMWSAMLAVSGSGQSAQLIGLEKELDDANKGSGFSFIDLSADKAGIYFAEYATLNTQQAMLLQHKMAVVQHYSDFMPNVLDLPEDLSLENFKQRYTSVYSPAYQDILKEIDQRIKQSVIYH